MMAAKLLKFCIDSASWVIFNSIFDDKFMHKLVLFYSQKYNVFFGKQKVFLVTTV
jgi:hypothetical protein